MPDRLSEGRWWDIGLQLVEGCTKVSLGCDNCWSLTAANMRRFNPNPKMAARYEGTVKRAMVPGAMMRPSWTGRVNPQWQDLDKVGAARKPQVYTFWNDLFHPGVLDGFVDNVMGRIQLHEGHFFIICTKRPDRAFKYFSERSFRGGGHFKHNLMLMTSAENQEMADLRSPLLWQIPGVLHGLSLEPMLGPVDFCQPFAQYLRELDWVVCGGETGPQARPMNLDWVRNVRDQCQAAGVPFFFKSWGEWFPALSLSGEEGLNFWKIKGKRNDSWGTLDLEGNWFPMTTPWNSRQGDDSPEGEYAMYRVGKKAAGRLLDGRTWDEMPEVMRWLN